ncbi:MAG: protein-export chaperone SecB [Thermodesulfobacteriota bacterium]
MQTRHLVGEKAKVDIKAVSRAIKQLEVENVFLLEAKIKSDPSTRSPRGVSLTYNFDVEILKREKEKLQIACHFTISAIRKDNPDNPLMNIEAKFAIEYFIQNPKKLKENDIDDFIKIDPVDTAWPYWREFVQNLTSRMGFPALTIPIIKFDFQNIERSPRRAISKKKVSKSD